MMKYYFLSFAEIADLSPEDLEELLERPAMLHDRFYRAKPINNHAVYGVLYVGMESCLKHINKLVTEGWLINLYKMIEEPVTICANLRSHGLNFHQVRAIYAQLIDIHATVANKIIKHFIPHSKFTIKNYDLNCDTMGLLFEPSMFKEIMRKMSAYESALMKKVSQIAGFTNPWKSNIESAEQSDDGVEKINCLLTNQILPEARSGNFHIRHIIFYNAMYNSLLCKQQRDDEDWKEIARCWTDELDRNTTSSKMRSMLDMDFSDESDESDDSSDSDCEEQAKREFLTFYQSIFELKTIISDLKRPPKNYLAFNNGKYGDFVSLTIFANKLPELQRGLKEDSRLSLLQYNVQGISYVTSALLRGNVETILFIVAELKNEFFKKVSEFLSQHSLPDLYQKNNAGETACSIAIRTHNNDILQALIACGFRYTPGTSNKFCCDLEFLNFKLSNGKTMLQLAIDSKNHNATSEILAIFKGRIPRPTPNAVFQVSSPRLR